MEGVVLEAPLDPQVVLDGDSLGGRTELGCRRSSRLRHRPSTEAHKHDQGRRSASCSPIQWDAKC